MANGGWWMTVLVVAAAVCSVPALTSPPEPSGRESGDLIEVEWRQATVTVFAPELVVLIRSLSDQATVLATEWEPRTCRGRGVELSQRSNSFLAMLLNGRADIRQVLEPRGWTALLLPLGLTIASEPPEGQSECESTLSVRAKSGGATETLRFSVPLTAAPVEGLDRRP